LNRPRHSIESAASFEKWFRDIPGTNLSRPLALDFIRQSDGSYAFDDTIDPLYRSLGGFFPVDNALFGNSPGTPNHNYHFTFEMHSEFTYDAAARQVFKFIGDDDVFVYIDGKMVIDLNGVHTARDQFVDLDRLGLVDGKTYTLDFFFAERHRTQSNFRIQTNIRFITPEVPTITGGYD
jgi:fibro-slime domain-containing protein